MKNVTKKLKPKHYAYIGLGVAALGAAAYYASKPKGEAVPTLVADAGGSTPTPTPTPVKPVEIFKPAIPVRTNPYGSGGTPFNTGVVTPIIVNPTPLPLPPVRTNPVVTMPAPVYVPPTPVYVAPVPVYQAPTPLPVLKPVIVSSTYYPRPVLSTTPVIVRSTITSKYPAGTLLRAGTDSKIYQMDAQGFKHYVSSRAVFDRLRLSMTSVRSITLAELNTIPTGAMLSGLSGFENMSLMLR